MIARFAMTWSAADIAGMRECADGDYVRWAAHVADTCKLRDKLLELAKACAECHGTGVVTVMAPPDSRLYSGVQISRQVDCPSCLDIREVVGQ